MNVTQRGAVVLVSVTATALSITSGASAAPAGSQATIQVANSCSQNPEPGYFTCFALKRTDLGSTSNATLLSEEAVSPSVTPNGYGPADLQSAYVLPSATAGSGRRVYIIDAYNDPNAEADLGVYRSQYGLPACTTANGCFKKLNQNGATSPLPATNTGWAEEIALDLDMVSAACPKCGITLMEASSNASSSLFGAAKEATTLGAKYVSMSFGGGEGGNEASLDSAYLKSTGVVYTASTGDSDYAAGAQYPATSPLVVAVGGTALHTSSNPRGWTESVWNSGTNIEEGTGSGCSFDEAKPSWQSIISASVCSHRAEADVSAVADPATGVAVYTTVGGSGWAVYGGTSASAPIMASVYALAGLPAATEKPASLPYANKAHLNDVTVGNNGNCGGSAICTAGVGWDGPTGLGTPNGVAAFTNAATSNSVVVNNPGAQTGTVGLAANLQLTGSDSGGLSLTYTATGLPTGLTIGPGGHVSGSPTAAGTFSVKVTAKDSTGASGSTTFAWTIAPVCSGQKLKNPGFESGATSWTQTAGVIKTDGAHSHAGVGYSKLGGTGTAHTDSVAQTVGIPTGCSATLTYYLLVNSAETTRVATDKLVLKANGTAIQTFSNLNKGTTYIQRTVNLTSYAGQKVTLKWAGTENAGLATTFYVDDTSLILS